MYEHEKQVLADTMDPNSNEYLIAHSSVLSKGKQLGII